MRMKTTDLLTIKLDNTPTNNVNTEINKTRKKIKKIQSELSSYFVERDEEIKGLTLAILSDANVFLLGKPGVGKSKMVKQWHKHITDSNYFKYLLSQFTVPEELTGPVSLSKLKEDKYVRNTKGMLPEAHTVVLEEIFKASSAIINFLLGILNEREFFNGGKKQKVPILSLVATSNEMPDPDGDLAAAIDRFILKYEVKDVEERSNYLKMMDSYLTGGEEPETTISLKEVEQARDYVDTVPVSTGVQNILITLLSKLKDKGIRVSGRKLNQSMRILKANAFLRGRDEVLKEDLDILQHSYWETPQQIKTVKNVILDLINPVERELENLLNKAKDIREEINGKIKADKGDVRGEIIESLQKLNVVLESMQECRKELKQEQSDTSPAKKAMKKVNDYVEELSNNSKLSVDIDELDL